MLLAHWQCVPHLNKLLCPLHIPLNVLPTMLGVSAVVSLDSHVWKAMLELVGETLIYYNEQTEMLRSYTVQD